jgi:hypothetical protein
MENRRAADLDSYDGDRCVVLLGRMVLISAIEWCCTPHNESTGLPPARVISAILISAIK